MARPIKYAAKIRELYAAGHSYDYIVQTLGCSKVSVNQALVVPEDTDDDGIDDLSGARCGCGLRLPCNSCLTDNRAYTRGPGRALPASETIDTNEINEACDRFMARRHAGR